AHDPHTVPRCGHHPALHSFPTRRSSDLTSGTTGVAKGVTCPHAQFYWWGRNMATQMPLHSDDVLHTMLPLFHTNALNTFFQALRSEEHTSELQSRFDLVCRLLLAKKDKS